MLPFWTTIPLLLTFYVNSVDGRPAAAVNPSSDTDYRLGIPRIIGGEDAWDGMFPSTLSIEYYGSLGWLHMCGGVLVKLNYAITVARCVANANVVNLRGWAGLLNRTDKVATNAQLLTVSSVTVHEGYDEFAPGIPNDIAIVRFTSDADISRANIALAVLPSNGGNDYHEDNCYLNGWGRFDDTQQLAETMKWIQVPVINNQQCSDIIETIQQANILQTHICFLSEPAGKGACNGDGGSPASCLVMGSNDERLVAGLMSWTITVEGNCNPYYPSVYTRLSDYVDWIAANTP